MPRDLATAMHELVNDGHSLEDIHAFVRAKLTLQPDIHPSTVDLETLPPASQPSLPDPLVPRAPSPPDPSTDTGPSPLAGLTRYEDLGLLGRGGMGEVRRVRDRALGRTLALKTLHATVARRPAAVARFREEAQATAQLQHPGIIPIHDIGTLPDGRLWFTMKEVTGQTLSTVLSEVHAASTTRWRPSPSGWTLRRLVDTLRQVCEAVGYAHSRGVVHRDLKPDNIMVGSHGEVLVLDWGLVKLLRTAVSASETDPALPVQSDRSQEGLFHTVVGQVAGTPAYMAPEQAHGRTDQIDARSDVYALGAILYTVLAGRPPYRGAHLLDVVEQVRSGPPRSLQHTGRFGGEVHSGAPFPSRADDPSGPVPPPVLVQICERAMARQPGDRFDHAAELAAELQSWLEGTRREQDALRVVARAREARPRAQGLRAEAARLRAEAALQLADLKLWQPEDDKAAAWALEDAATALEQQALLAELEEEVLLQGSLTHAPELPEAHAALAARYRAEHVAAETSREDATRAETLLRRHLTALPSDHPDRRQHLTYLQGDGALTLVTDPPGATVQLYQYAPLRRRLAPRFLRTLGTTPLQAVSLPMGSYLCVIQHPKRAEVRYPVSIGRGEHWHGVPPEGGEAHPIRLPPRGALTPEEVYIPAGWFKSGGDPHQERSLPERRVWVDGQIFRRFPITNRQYMAFLDALVKDGRADEALRHAPRERGGTVGEPGALIFGFDDVHFFLRPDSDGDTWEPDTPVCMVDWAGALAYAIWQGQRDGHAWSLPAELAWEKAARGVDGRFHPWGDAFDPSWCCMRDSHPRRMLPRAVGTFPHDESPYGVRDLAGSMADWCADRYTPAGPDLSSVRSGAPRPRTLPSIDPGTPTLRSQKGARRRIIRGGSWSELASGVRTTFRYWYPESDRSFDIGFRLARPYPEDSGNVPDRADPPAGDRPMTRLPR